MVFVFGFFFVADNEACGVVVFSSCPWSRVKIIKPGVGKMASVPSRVMFVDYPSEFE
jgi:hypothetical protein